MNGRPSVPGAPFATPPILGLLPRIVLLALVLGVELLLLSVWLDNASLVSRGGILAVLGRSAPWAVRGMVGFAAIFFTFAYLWKGAALQEISRGVQGAPLGRGLAAAHAAAMGVFSSLAWSVYGNHLNGSLAGAMGVVCLAVGLCGLALAAFAVVPLPAWVEIVRATGALWAYSLLAVVGACAVGAYSRSLWTPLVALTFTLVKGLLGIFVGQIVAKPASAILGTPRFSVEIAPECSGLEGAGLILAFGTVWLWFFRKECRFPHALLLLPAGVIAVFLLNAVRLAALILIGDAGAPRIALGGFHSQAGWIAFNLVAFGLAVAARRLTWFSSVGAPSVQAEDQAAPSSVENPATTYLMPFLSIIVVGMLATAVSSGFEWLYPLRLVAAAGVLWTYRRRYAALDWSFGWFGPSMGALVFALWIGADLLWNKDGAGSARDIMPAALAASPAIVRQSWIACRALGAIATVPIAEELAFRGFLIRRFLGPDVDAWPTNAYTWLGLGVSSAAFGLMHGTMWLAGILAGLCYAWALIRGNRIGEAVIAHATTNALLAAYVLTFQKWHLW